MLTLTRKADESILIGPDIRIIIKRIDGDTVKIGVEAPRSVPIFRSEVFAKVSSQNQEAVAKAQKVSSRSTGLKLNWPVRPVA